MAKSEQPHKTERLQLRIEGEDKKWFKGFCKPHGGMSVYIQDHVKSLRSAERHHPDFGDPDEHSERTGD